MNNEYDDLVFKYAKQNNLQPELVKGLIDRESSFDPGANRYEPMFYAKYLKNNVQYKDHPLINCPRTFSSSYGLCQLMYTTALENDFDESNGFWLLYNPEININIACIYLSKLKERFKTRIVPNYDTPEEKMLSAYNAGQPIQGNRYTYVDYIIQKSFKYLDDFKDF